MLRRLNAIVAHFALALACALALGAVSLFPAASEAQQAEATASPPSYPPNSQPGLSQTLSGGLRIQLNLGGTDVDLGRATMANSIPVTIASDRASLPVTDTQGTNPWVTADNGTPITGASMPSGGAGVTGWLSAIWKQLTGTISVTQGTSPWVSADNGTAITGASMPSGGAGITGWLSAIWKELGGTLAVAPSITPAAPTVGASNAITSLVLKGSPTASPGGVQYFHAENATTTSGYCVLYNATSAPGAGALTAANVLWFQSLPANGSCDFTAAGVPPIPAGTGAVVLITSASTPYTYTTGVITAAIAGLAL